MKLFLLSLILMSLSCARARSAGEIMRELRAERGQHYIKRAFAAEISADYGEVDCLDFIQLCFRFCEKPNVAQADCILIQDKLLNPDESTCRCREDPQLYRAKMKKF